MNVDRPSIILFASQLYRSPGGIETYGRRVREILEAYVGLNSGRYYCLSLADEAEESGAHARPVLHGSFVGCRDRKIWFCLKAMEMARKVRGSLGVVTHLGLSPVAWVLQNLGLLRGYIVLLHGMEAWRKVPWLDRRAGRRARLILATTNHTASEYCRHNGVPTSRVRIIPLAVADQSAEIPTAPETRRNCLQVLTVARLVRTDRYKGVDVLIQAIERVRTQGVPIHLNVVGNGDDAPRLQELVVRSYLDSGVSFLGVVSDSRLRELYQECDVFALPSTAEGFGLVFLESMRYGKPCIGANIAGVREVINHGSDGYLIEVGRVDQLAGYLIELARKPELRRIMGRIANEKVKRSYLFSNMRQNWFCLLDEVLRD